MFPQIVQPQTLMIIMRLQMSKQPGMIMAWHVMTFILYTTASNIGLLISTVHSHYSYTLVNYLLVQSTMFTNQNRLSREKRKALAR